MFGERNGYTARLSGYLVAPYTGEISFYLATSDQATLFVSNNTDPANRSKLKRYTNGRSDKLPKSGKCNSIFLPSCRTVVGLHNTRHRTEAISVEEGKLYYLEVHHVQRASKAEANLLQV